MKDPNQSSETKTGKIGDRPDWVRTGSVFIRALHLLGASVVTGAYLLDSSLANIHPYLIIAAVTGLLLVITETVRHVQLYREAAGWATIVKILLLAWVPVFPEASVCLFTSAFLLAAVFAHLPRRYRHRLLF